MSQEEEEDDEVPQEGEDTVSVPPSVHEATDKDGEKGDCVKVLHGV